MMESLAIEDKIIRNKAFKALVRSKKEWLIKYGKSLSGKTVKDTYDYHLMWESIDGRCKVGVGKFGKDMVGSTFISLIEISLSAIHFFIDAR